MSILSLIIAEAITIKREGIEYPCVVLIGREKDTNKKLKWRTVFYPYCYILEKDYRRLKEENINLDVYIREAVGTYKRSLTKLPLTKIYFHNDTVAKEFIKLLRKHHKLGLKDPIYTYEGEYATSKDLIALRFLIDNKIRSGYIIDKDNKVKPVDYECKLRILFIDFEAYSSKMCGHGAKKNERIMMVTLYDNYEDKLFTLYTENTKWTNTQRRLIRLNFKKQYSNHLIKSFDSEAKLLDYLMGMTITLNPDIISAWNLDRYDLPQWKYGVDSNKDKCFYSFKYLSPLKSINPYCIPYRIKGRILFDLMRAFKKYTQAELRSYSLENTAINENIPIEKVHFIGTTANTWDNYPEVIFKRNVNDVLIMKALDDKYELVDMFNDLRYEFGALFHEVFMNYRIVDTELLRFVSDSTALMTAKGNRPEGKFKGAVVVEPNIGAHSNIAQLDFSREYPYIMMMFNISPETYREEDYSGECYTVEYEDNTYKFIKEPIGLLPKLIKFFFDKRDEYDSNQLKAIKKGDTVKAKMWYRRSFLVKGICNSIYGVMDYSNFRLYKRECSAATAVIGRLSIEEINRIINSLGYELIYGDTDSIFVKLKSKGKEELVTEAKTLQDKLNDKLTKFFIDKYKVKSAPSKIKLDKIYSRYLLLAKKNYAGGYFYDKNKGILDKLEYDFKGYEVIRSDSSNLEKNILEKLTKLWLDEENIKVIEEYINSSYEQLRQKEIDIFNLAYPQQIKRKFIDYGYNYQKKKKITIPSLIRATIYSNRYLNTDFERGDKPSRLPIVEQKKKKHIEGQSTLFTEDEIYPNLYTFERVKGDIRKWSLKGIAIADGMEVPEYFISRIDYYSIMNRLKGKVDKIMCLVKEFK